MAFANVSFIMMSLANILNISEISASYATELLAYLCKIFFRQNLYGAWRAHQQMILESVHLLRKGGQMGWSKMGVSITRNKRSQNNGFQSLPHPIQMSFVNEPTHKLTRQTSKVKIFGEKCIITIPCKASIDALNYFVIFSVAAIQLSSAQIIVGTCSTLWMSLVDQMIRER